MFRHALTALALAASLAAPVSAQDTACNLSAEALPDYLVGLGGPWQTINGEGLATMVFGGQSMTIPIPTSTDANTTVFNVDGHRITMRAEFENGGTAFDGTGVAVLRYGALEDWYIATTPHDTWEWPIGTLTDPDDQNVSLPCSEEELPILAWHVEVNTASNPELAHVLDIEGMMGSMWIWVTVVPVSPTQMAGRAHFFALPSDGGALSATRYIRMHPES